MPFDKYPQNIYRYDASHHLLAIDTSSAQTSIALMSQGKIFSDIKVGQREHAKWILPAISSLLSQASLSLSQLGAIIYGQGPGSFTGLRIGCSIAKGLAYAHDLPLIPISDLYLIAQQAHDLYFSSTANVIHSNIKEKKAHPQKNDAQLSADHLHQHQTLPSNGSAIANLEISGFLSVINAHMNQLYWAYYDTLSLSIQNTQEVTPSDATSLAPEYLSHPAQITLPKEGPFILTGLDFVALTNQLSSAVQKNTITQIPLFPSAVTMLQIAQQKPLSIVDAQTASLVYLNNPFS